MNSLTFSKIKVEIGFSKIDMHTNTLVGSVCKVYGDHGTLNHKSNISTCKGTRIGRSLLKYRSVASINGRYIDLGSI